MINQIDRAIERFLRERVPLPEASIGLAFDAPDSAWGAALNRPTVNVFLWDICRAGGNSARTGIQERRSGTGRVERRPASPVMEFHYLITGWASEMKDEHQLLGLVLRTVLTHPKLPEGYLPDGVASGTCALSLAGSDEPVRGDFWSALGGKLKPALKLRVSVPVDVFGWSAAGPDVTTVELSPDLLTPIPAGTAPATRPAVAAGDASADTVAAPLIRRQRRNATLVMEGRRAPAGGGGTAREPGSTDS